MPIPQALENPHITFDSQKTLLISLLLTGSLANNVNCGLSRVLYMYYVLYSYDKVNYRKENVIETIIGRENTFTILYLLIL